MTAQATDATPTATSERRWSRARATGLDPILVAQWVVATAGFVCLLAVHGFLPGASQPTVQAHLASGATECLRKLGVHALWERCSQVGYPAGQPLLSGIVETYASTMVSHLPVIDSWTAHVLVDVLCLVAGYVGMTILLRRWGAAPWAAIGGAFGYLSSMSIVWINGFAATFNGFVLLPVHVLLVVVALDQIDRGLRRSPALLMLGGAMLAAFTDGYAFFEGTFVAGTLVVWWALRGSDAGRRARATGAAMYGIAFVVAALSYTLYVPAGAYETPVAIGTFRALGADLATILVPQRSLWWTSRLGFDTFFGDGWADYSAYSSNYLGYILIGLALWALVRKVRPRTTVPLVIAGAGALILALGPSLKAWDFRTTATALASPAHDMPASEAQFGLPTTWLFVNVPGLSDMRATYRWVFVAVFCLFCCGALAVSAIAKRGRPMLAAALAVLAAVEVLPNVGAYASERRTFESQLRYFRRGPARELADTLGPADVALFLPAGNDWSVNSMIPFTDATTFNVGIDKNYVYARDRWPASIGRAVGAYGTIDEVDAVADALRLDATVVLYPAFDLQLAAQSWPSLGPDPGGADVRGDLFEADSRFTVHRGQWFVTVRLANDSAEVATE